MGRTSATHTIFRAYSRTARLRGLMAALCTLGSFGCYYPPIGTLVDANSNPIRQSAITHITEDEKLTDSEKRDALRALGIQDDALIELILQ